MDNGWRKIEADAIDTTETPLSGPGARVVFLKVDEAIRQAVCVRLQDGRQGYVRVEYPEYYYYSMSLVFHSLAGIEIVQN